MKSGEWVVEKEEEEEEEEKVNMSIGMQEVVFIGTR